MKLVKVIYDLMKTLKCIEKIEVSDIIIDNPIANNELNKIEVELDFQFPKELKDLYIHEASTIKFKWVADKSTFGSVCRSGEFNLLSPTNILDMYSDMMYEVQQAKVNNELEYDEGLKAIVKDWAYWIPIIRFSNGDAFCIDKRNLHVVFLEHDVMDAGPSVHGLKLATCFEKLITQWLKVALVDVYDWSEVCDSEGLDINCNQFDGIRELFKFE